MELTSKKYIAYIGTYTSGNSEGIYIFNMNSETGRLEQLGTASDIANPSYLAISKDNKYLYSVIETEKFNGELGGGVASFTIDRSTGKLNLINTKGTKGVAPCHLCVNESNSSLYVANYGEGTVSSFSLDSKGGIDSLTSILVHEGWGPDVDRQEKAHAHCVVLTAKEEYLCAVDLGIDETRLYNLSNNRSLLFSAEHSIALNPGSGPRHIIFHANGKFAYIINELGSTVTVLNYSETDYKFSVVQYISTLPDGYEGENAPGAIHISPDGKFLYASNRGHDSIAVFKINKSSGKLELVSHSATEGKYPRDFEIDPTGKYLYVANQLSDNVTAFAICSDTGKLEPLGITYNIPSPVCIKFARIN